MILRPFDGASMLRDGALRKVDNPGFRVNDCQLSGALLHHAKPIMIGKQFTQRARKPLSGEFRPPNRKRQTRTGIEQITIFRSAFDSQLAQHFTLNRKINDF